MMSYSCKLKAMDYLGDLLGCIPRQVRVQFLNQWTVGVYTGSSDVEERNSQVTAAECVQLI